MSYVIIIGIIIIFLLVVSIAIGITAIVRTVENKKNINGGGDNNGVTNGNEAAYLYNSGFTEDIPLNSTSSTSLLFLDNNTVAAATNEKIEVVLDDSSGYYKEFKILADGLYNISTSVALKIEGDSSGKKPILLGLIVYNKPDPDGDAEVVLDNYTTLENLSETFFTMISLNGFVPLKANDRIRVNVKQDDALDKATYIRKVQPPSYQFSITSVY